MEDSEFVDYFEGKVASTISDHKLADASERILVAVSGGKDSTTALYILKKLGYNVEGIIIDQLLGEYSKNNLENIRDFCRQNNIILHVVRMRDEYGCSVCYMKSVLDEKGVSLSSCAICGVIRRSVLNRKARELCAEKIATGHNMDDEVQTFFMNAVSGNIKRSARLGPKTGLVDDKRFVPRIKPLYFCGEADVERYSKIMGFPVVYDPCPCAVDSLRTEVKKALNEIEGENPGAKDLIMRFFMEIRPRLRESQPKNAVGECALCGEPSSGKVCRTCSILCNLSVG